MILIMYYIAMLLVADAASVVLCLWIEKFWPALSMPIFIGLYFLSLWVAWLVAVRITEPTQVQQQPAE
jgi:hypothetical protein